ncbi:MAG: FkbM family methyltransferase [Microcoleaceae cyanobacterium]
MVDTKKSVKEYMKIGANLLLESKYEEAEKVYRQVIELKPEHPWVNCNLGRSLLHQGKFEAAIPYLQKAIELDSNIAEAYYNLGSAFSKKSQFYEAVNAYRKAIELEPNKFLYHHQLGDIFLLQKKYAEAVNPYRKAIELNCEYVWSYTNLARTLSELGQYQDAIATYEKAIELDPNQPTDQIHLYQALADLLQQQGKLEESRLIYQKLLNIDNSSPWAYRGLGNVLTQQHQLDQAVSAYQRSIELKPDEYHTYEVLGYALEKQQKFSEAIIAYRQALELQPDHTAIQRQLEILEQKAAQRVTESSVSISASYQGYPPMDIIVTPNEVNHHHGTGILIERIFKQGSKMVSIRSQSHHNGEQDFGEVILECSCLGASREEIFRRVLNQLNGIKAKRVVCIPYYPEDVLITLAIKEIFGVHLCTYIMDDQNVHADGIPDSLMQELLEKSDLLLAISPEVRDAYEMKYDRKFWLFPGIVPNELIEFSVKLGSDYPQFCQSKRGILVGNIWSQRWLDSLRETIKGAGVQIDWYANLKPSWLNFDRDQLERDGIIQKGLVPEKTLVQILRNYPYTILPTGSTNETDDRPEIAKLSLPSRIPFILATTQTPIIVLGDKNTSAARFIEQFNTGTICDYNPTSFRQAIEYVCSPTTQINLRNNALKISETLSADGVDQWLWDSLEKGEPADLRFETFMPRRKDSLVPFIESPTPKDIWREFVPDYQAIRRLKEKDYYPDFVIDIGASTGIWSYTVNKLFPKARFILIDPLMSRHDQSSRKYYIDPNQNFEVVEAAVSDAVGSTSFQISPDFYGSSLLTPNDGRDYETVPVKVITLDSLKAEKNISGTGILKIDVQCAEHLVLAGGSHFLNQVDVIVIELSLVRFEERAKILLEMMQLLNDLGFSYYDDAGDWRSPFDGTLLQKDVIFAKTDGLLVRKAVELSQGK